MRRYLVNYPPLLRMLYPKRLSRIKEKKSIFLSFDDGPVPGITPWVLETLQKYDAKATFFCVGDNIRKYPAIFQQIISEGHRIGNHSFHHLNGWKTSPAVYLKDIWRCQEQMRQENHSPGDKLFRPPYGKIKNSQARLLRAAGFQIVMWDVLSGDFDASTQINTCYHNLLNNLREGSIVVFHDSDKASKNLRAVLPAVLEYYSERGFIFRKL